MVTIKRKVTIRIKKPQEQITVGNSVGEKPNEPKPSPPTPDSEKQSKSGKIIGSFVAAVAILAGIYFFAIKDNSGDTNMGATTEQAAQTAETAESNNSETAEQTNAESATTNAETAEPSEANETPAATEKGNVPTTAKADENKADAHSANETPQPENPLSTKQTITTTTTKRTSAPITGDVEENARRVIRGDFGNGQPRKDKLGTSYSEIQGRVNEMYRQGLVH